MTDNTKGYDLIDPPVNAYSDKAAIRVWIDDLKSREQTDEVKIALTQAQEWLSLKK